VNLPDAKSSIQGRSERTCGGSRSRPPRENGPSMAVPTVASMDASSPNAHSSGRDRVPGMAALEAVLGQDHPGRRPG
jgi:hypothetical protein